jgi:hypothetical protein
MDDEEFWRFWWRVEERRKAHEAAMHTLAATIKARWICEQLTSR